MRDPSRIKRIASLLEEVWTEVPQWRLTQLVINTTDTHHDCGPVYFMEDDEFEKKLLDLKTGLKQVNKAKS